MSTLRIAVAQTHVPEDAREASAIRAAGAQIRECMNVAASGGARLAVFPEGALVYPDKRRMSSVPGTLAAADWDHAAWTVIREESEAIAALAAELRLWVAFGAPHRLTPPRRPHNSLYIISDKGRVAGRYDKRILSNSELSYLYTPGHDPLVFEVDGIRFGTALCIEANFPELFAAYEAQDVDCVLLPVMVDDAARARVAEAYGTLYNMWIAYAVPAQYSSTAPAGLVAPGGGWLTNCRTDGTADVSFAEIDKSPAEPSIRIALQAARPWRRIARTDPYSEHRTTDDPRSTTKHTF